MNDKWMFKRKYLVNCIARFIDEYKMPKSCYNTSFEAYTYAVWSLKELREYLLTNRNRDPLELLDEFIGKMDKASTMYPPEVGYCFSVAKDTALYVYDMVYISGYYFVK